MPELLIRDEESVGESENNSIKLMEFNLIPQQKWDEDYFDSPRLENNCHAIDKDVYDTCNKYHEPGVEEHKTLN